MKVLGILGAHKEHGVTRMMLDQVLHQVQAPNTSEIIYLEDYQIKPDIKGQPNPTMDQIIAKLEAADVWVIAAPTYWGGLSGVICSLTCFCSLIAATTIFSASKTGLKFKLPPAESS